MTEILHDMNIFVIGFAIGWVAYPLWISITAIWKNAKKASEKDKK